MVCYAHTHKSLRQGLKCHSLPSGCRRLLLSQTHCLCSVTQAGRSMQQPHMQPGSRLTIATETDDTATAASPALPVGAQNRAIVNPVLQIYRTEKVQTGVISQGVWWWGSGVEVWLEGTSNDRNVSGVMGVFYILIVHGLHECLHLSKLIKLYT